MTSCLSIKNQTSMSSSARCRRKQAQPRRKKDAIVDATSGESTVIDETPELEGTESESLTMSPSTSTTHPESNTEPRSVDSTDSDKMIIDEDSVVNHGSGESGVDLGSSSAKDDLIHSPGGSLASSTFSESLNHFTTGQTNLPFVCEQCGLTFTQREELEKHELSLHPSANQSCKICLKQFANVYRLQRHMISHDESAGLRKFKCPDCEKAFKFKHHLKEHVRIHSGEKPFICKNCGKRFSHSGSYSSHTTSKKCLIMNLKLGGRGKVAVEGKPVSSLHRLSHPSSKPYHKLQRNLLSASPTFPIHPQTLALGSKTSPGRTSTTSSTDNNFTTHTSGTNNNDESQNYPSTSPPFLPPGPVNFHPFFVSASNAGLPTNPYALNVNNFFNGLPQNLPFGHLARMIKEEESAATQDSSSGFMVEKKLNGSFYPKSRSHSRSPSDRSANTHDDGDENDRDKRRIVFNGNSTAPSTISGRHHDNASDSDKDSLDNVNKVHRMLETVSANVTRQLLEACQLKNICDPVSPAPSSTNSSTHSKSFDHDDKMEIDSDMHQNNNNNCIVKSKDALDLERQRKKNGIEGLAARLEFSRQQQQVVDNMRDSGNEDYYMSRSHEDHQSSNSEDESNEHNDPTESSEATEEGRRARVRSLFSESQLTILRHHYAMDPRPRRDQLLALSHKLVLQLRVVQVWFQNSRARDRREGRPPQCNNSNSTSFASKPNSKSSGFSSALALAPLYNNGLTTASRISSVTSSISNWNISRPTKEQKDETKPFNEQPLDLSTKKSSPSNSPRPSTITSEPMTSESEDERAPSPAMQPLNLKSLSKSNPASNHSTNTPMLFRLVTEENSPNRNTSSPGSLSLNNSSRLARILSQPTTSPPSGTSLYKNNRQTNGSINGSLDTRTPSPTVSLGPIVTPMLSSLLPPSNSPLDFGLTGINSPLNLFTNSNGDHLPVFPNLNNNNTGRSRHLPRKRKAVKSKPKPATAVTISNGDESGQFACDQCEKQFNKQSSLARHKYEHSGQRPYKCDSCEKAFKHKHHLTEHLRLHTGSKPYMCPKCNKKFSHSGSYSQHMNHRYAYCKPNIPNPISRTN